MTTEESTACGTSSSRGSWVVDPESRVVVPHLFRGDVLPGFGLPLRDLFPDE